MSSIFTSFHMWELIPFYNIIWSTMSDFIASSASIAFLCSTRLSELTLIQIYLLYHNNPESSTCNKRSHSLPCWTFANRPFPRESQWSCFWILSWLLDRRYSKSFSDKRFTYSRKTVAINKAKTLQLKQKYTKRSIIWIF